jgi:hypothetical protein
MPQCPFYGYHAIEAFKVLVSSGGNQCGLITAAYAPCRMETAGLAPVLEECNFNGTGVAREFERFDRCAVAPQRPVEDYPDAYPG